MCQQIQKEFKLSEEWGINLSMFNRLKSFLPKTILWRLTFLNVLIIALTITVSTWALYHAACFLVEGIGHLEQQRQTQFNTTLFQYLLLCSARGITIASIIYFFLLINHVS